MIAFEELFIHLLQSCGTLEHKPHWSPEPGELNMFLVAATNTGTPKKGKVPFLGSTDKVQGELKGSSPKPLCLEGALADSLDVHY